VDIFQNSWLVVSAVWPGMLLGTGLLIVAAGAGVALTQVPTLPLVRSVRWWVRHVAMTVIRSPRFTVRATLIFANNSLVLATLVALGAWPWISIIAVAVLGLNLGIGLPLLATETEGHFLPTLERLHAEPERAAMRRRLRLGLTLNLFEPPAIMMAIGLSLQRATLSYSAAMVWETFLIWIVPMTLVAAGGEAMWLGTVRGDATETPNLQEPDESSPQNRPSDQGEPPP